MRKINESGIKSKSLIARLLIEKLGAPSSYLLRGLGENARYCVIISTCFVGVIYATVAVSTFIVESAPDELISLCIFN